MTEAEKLSYLVHNITFDDLPLKLTDRTKYLALDYIGLAARGSLRDSSQPVYEFIRDVACDGKGSIVGKPELRSLSHYVALANGTAAHSLELDDVTIEASIHPGVVIFPTSFALAEEIGASGKKLIEATVAGYEVMRRLGKALHPTKMYQRGFHPTGICGIFGAVATASKLLNLTIEETTNAFGIAGSQSSGSMEFLETGAWTKRLHPGWAAHSAIIATKLAKKGFKGPTTIIEGENGFAKSYSDEYDLSGIDREFSYVDNAIMRTSIKAHACCRYKQGPLDSILNIVKSNDIQPDDIISVDIYLLDTAQPIISLPAKKKRNPQTLVDAQFSMHFGAAVAVIYRNTLLEEYTQDVVNTSRVKEMMNRIHCYHDPELDKDFPRMWPSRVIIKTNKGEYYDQVKYPKGDPENPLNWNELIDKFKYVSQPIYSSNDQSQIINCIKNMDKVEDIKEITTLL
jgi:2-methylcitrate dehydratase PrpD